MAKPFHLGWFLQGSSIQSWNQPWTGDIAEDWMSARFFLDLVKNLERAKFDYLLLEDVPYIGEAYGNSRDIYLNRGIAVPRQDPSIVAALMLAATSQIGVVATLATFTHHPYLLARIMGTLDQVSGGRSGWNVVTGSSDFAAQNLGMPDHPPHDERYAIAEEFIACVTQLWDSWEPGAIVNDTVAPMLIDHTKVRQIDFAGQYFKSRGPLNSGPAPQGRPVIAQAGGSPRGRAFAAKHADTIVTSVFGKEAMTAYKQDVMAQMSKQGRDPDACKLLFVVAPTLGATEQDAWALKRRQDEATMDHIQDRLATLSKFSNIDFSALALDEPVPENLTTNGNQSTLKGFTDQAKGKTLRRAIMDYNIYNESLELVGTPEQVAAMMIDAMEACGGDGYLFSPTNTTRRTVAEITDGLIPELQKRGAVRTRYNFDQLRQNLLEF